MDLVVTVSFEEMDDINLKIEDEIIVFIGSYSGIEEMIKH